MKDMGEMPSDASRLEQINKRKNFEPGNCRWAAAPPPKKPGKLITFRGETHNLKEWSKISGVYYMTLRRRLGRGVPFAEAIEAE
jgi:hypothetical protein